MNENLQTLLVLYFLFFFLIFVFISFEIYKYLKKSKDYKEKIMSLNAYDLSKKQFEKTYNIKCDYCGKIFNTSNSTCPNCNGIYHNNKVYLEEMRKTNIEYYNYLKNLQKDIKEKFDTYCKVARDLKKVSL